MSAPIRYSHDHADMQLERIHAFLADSYWAKDIPFDLAATSIENSVVAGAFAEDEQIGLARLVTDKATFAYLADVYVEDDFRGRRIAFEMVKRLQELPELQSLRHWHLVTRDAQPLYAKLGWEAVPHPDRHMQRIFNLYGTPARMSALRPRSRDYRRSCAAGCTRAGYRLRRWCAHGGIA